jgi:hypothetical protein
LKTSKDEPVPALKAPFALCDNAFDSIAGGGAQELLKSGNTQRSKFYALLYATLHDNEEYGYLAMYR